LELAKRLATIDALSGGRLLYGIGSGWLREECDGLFGGDHRDAGLYSKGFPSITTFPATTLSVAARQKVS
jgi:alkanesulfonate monooxygenase SsuD/methylene tetrahydromethanopterin reductase-like flavin-dependent oxidoreductase (luciferase family)